MTLADLKQVLPQIAPETVLAQIRRWDQPKVEALIHAGWQFLLPENADREPYQWAWRAPAKQSRRPGRRYPSTGQAYNAMLREARTASGEK